MKIKTKIDFRMEITRKLLCFAVFNSDWLLSDKWNSFNSKYIEQGHIQGQFTGSNSQEVEKDFSCSTKKKTRN